MDPLSSDAYSTLGRILFRARRSGGSLLALQRAVELEPRNAEAWFRIGNTYAELRRYDEAIAAYEKSGRLTSDFEDSRAAIARVHALEGHNSEARKILAHVKASRQSLAAVYAALGDSDRAFGLLEGAG